MRLAQYRCEFVGWILAWASSVFISATIRAGQDDLLADGVPTSARMIWQTADAVPPLAKLALGGALAVLLLVARWSTRETPSRIVLGGAFAGAAAMAFALGVPALRYYPALPAPDITAHYVAGLAAGLIFAGSWLGCARRTR